MVTRALVLLGALASAACAARTPPAHVPDLRLEGTDGAAHLLPSNRVVVLVFYSPSCGFLHAHSERLQKMYEPYASRGVEFFFVDSESSGSLERDTAEARARGYLFPIVRDPGGRLARAVGAEYALHTVILGRDGAVLYRGAMDGDGLRLHDDAPMYLRDALDDVLAGRAPRVSGRDAPGCALQLW
jgi:hypothetical protein